MDDTKIQITDIVVNEKEQKFVSLADLESVMKSIDTELKLLNNNLQRYRNIDTTNQILEDILGEVRLIGLSTDNLKAK